MMMMMMMIGASDAGDASAAGPGGGGDDGGGGGGVCKGRGAMCVCMCELRFSSKSLARWQGGGMVGANIYDIPVQ